MEYLKLLSKIALSFQNLTDFDKRMNEILAEIAGFIDVSRIYIFLKDNEETVSNVFEWCDEGITSQIQNLQKINNTNMSSFHQMLKMDGYIRSSDINNLPQEIIDTLKPQKIKSIVVYPLVIKKEEIGFIGFDECRYKREWKAEELEILKTISGLVANAYQRKFVQEHLVASENNFRHFFETIEDMFVITKLDGQILHCNQSLVDKLGYSLLELRQKNVSTLNPVDKRLEATESIQKMLKGEAETCYLTVESKFGDNYLVNTRIWYGKWNEEDCLFSISKDITREVENLQLFSTIFEKNPLPMVIVNFDDGKVTEINPEFIVKIGYTKSDIVGETIEEVNLFIDIEEKEKIKQKQLNGEKIIEEELSIRCKDGSVLIGLVSIEEIISKGKPALLIVIVDITERVELTLSVEDKYEKLTNIIDGTRLGTWEWNITTGEMTCNDYWGGMLGYSLTELAPINMDTWKSLTHPGDLAIASEIIEKHLTGEAEFYECEMRLKHKDGRWIWAQGRGKVTKKDAEGKPLTMFGTHWDISPRKQAEETLRESEERFLLALEKTKAGLWDIELTKKTIYLSPMWKNILGYKEDEIEANLDIWKQIIHPDDIEAIEKTAEDFIDGALDTYEYISRFKHKDGDWRWILVRGGALKNENGIPTRLIGTNIDITIEHEQAVELERFFTVNSDLLCITNLEGRFIKTNKAWEEILGYSSEELRKRNFLDFIHPDDIHITVEALKELVNNEEAAKFVNRYMSIDGTYHYIEWKSNSYGNLIYAAARDITDRVAYEKKILEISNRDSLTKAYTRRYIFSRVKEIIEENQRTDKLFSICIIDLDKFKTINDNYGHQAGDYVLEEFAKIIDENLRPYDLFGRYGGEEFIIVLNGADAAKGKKVIERILTIIREKTFCFNNNNIKITFSAGISTCRDILPDMQILQGEIIDKLIAIADQRMYYAKEMGRNKVVFQDQ